MQINDTKVRSRNNNNKEQTFNGANLLIQQSLLSANKDLAQPSFHNILRGSKPRGQNFEKSTTQDIYLTKRNENTRSASKIRRNSIYNKSEEQEKSVATTILTINSPSSANSNDRQIVRETGNLPTIGIASRNCDPRGEKSERLYLDRRQLKNIPPTEGEEDLKLLSLQTNLIERISNLETFGRLVYLDITDNRIHQISGLESLVQLKVLVLGRNDIRSIENLNNLLLLDVLDLHANKIRNIENINHLKQLRVLNLSNNFINQVNNIGELTSLIELNLKRNKIKFVYELDSLPNLSRLFMSNNDILSFEDMICIGSMPKLSELTLEGNPFSHDLSYKQTLLRGCPNIKLLDLKKISDEEKRIAISMCKRDEERKKETSKAADLIEKRTTAISNAKQRWQNNEKDADVNQSDIRAVHVDTIPNGKSTHSSCDEKIFEEEEQKTASPTSVKNAKAATQYTTITSSQIQSDKKKQSGGQIGGNDSYAEIENSTLNIFGAGSVDAFERSWGAQAAGAVNTIAFHFVDFNEIAKQLHKIRIRFPNVSHLSFNNTNLSTLIQLNALACVRRLERLTIEESGNSIVKLSLFKPYAIYRLLHLGLKNINGVQITHVDMATADKYFNVLDYNITNAVPKFRLASLIGDRKKFSQLEDEKQKDVIIRKVDRCETLARTALVYNLKEKSQKSESRKVFVNEYVDCLQDAAREKNKSLRNINKQWKSLVKTGVEEIIKEYFSDPSTSNYLAPN